MQSLVLKWASYDFAEHEGYNYLRVKGNFVMNENEKYRAILMRSDDDNIGIFVIIPKTAENIWSKLKDILSIIKKEETQIYKEIWIPAFKAIKNNSSDVMNLLGGSLSGKTIINVFLQRIMNF